MKLLSKLTAFLLVISMYSCTESQETPGIPNDSDEITFLQLRRYHYHSPSQETLMDQYFKEALIPALHRMGAENVGVFKPHDQQDSSIFMLLPFTTMTDFAQLEVRLAGDSTYLQDAGSWSQIPYDHPPYSRMESYLLRTFSESDGLMVPDLDTQREGRIYELRSYQSATEELHRKKVEMFNEGELQLFIELGFQPVFFAEVLSSAHMPHLMYMTVHADSVAQEANWDAFRAHPEWERMKNLECYQHTVSHIDKYLLYPVDYSDY